jgi:hypothetical protein
MKETLKNPSGLLFPNEIKGDGEDMQTSGTQKERFYIQ